MDAPSVPAPRARGRRMAAIERTRDDGRHGAARRSGAALGRAPAAAASAAGSSGRTPSAAGGRRSIASSRRRTSTTRAAASRSSAGPAGARSDRRRPVGRRAVVIYDAIDDVFEWQQRPRHAAPCCAAGTVAARRRWARSADARIDRQRGPRRASRGSLGAPAGRDPELPGHPIGRGAGRRSGARPRDRSIRAATGLPATTRIVLFQGRLGPRARPRRGRRGRPARARRGARPARVRAAGSSASAPGDADPRFAGRHVTLPAVHPDELLAWTAVRRRRDRAAAAGLGQPAASTPNKFWEALAAGTPVVVPAGLTYMAGIVATGDLGVVARGASPEALADGIAAALARSDADPAWRGRIRATAVSTYSWAAIAPTYRALVDSVAPPPGGPPG